MEKERLLIKESIEGNEKAFANIINIYRNYVFAIILNFIKDYQEAENVAQEVFIQIYTSLPSYDNGNFKAWIGRIASNKSIDWIRKRKVRFNEEVCENTAELIDGTVSDKSSSPEAYLVEREKKEAVMRVLNGIPEIYRIAVEKFYFQEKSYEIIANEENVPVKTIASRLYRAKILLKEKWREENETL